MVLLQTTLDMHGKKAPESLQPFHAHLEKRFAQMKGFVEREYSIKVSKLNSLKEPLLTETRMASHGQTWA